MVSTIGKDIAFTQLSIKTNKSILGQVLFVSIALIIPTVTHNLGINYLVSQPMHWMVIFAGLTYGMASGTILGLLIPILSFFLSGMPVATALPLMIPELMVYGFISGLLKKNMTSFGSIFTALVVGKIAYLCIAVALGRINIPLFTFINKIWGPGLITMIIQIVSIPVLSGLYINWIKTDND